MELSQNELFVIRTSLSHRLIRIDEMIVIFKNHQDNLQSQRLLGKYFREKDDVKNLLDKVTEII
jgi:hypothetical protein